MHSHEHLDDVPAYLLAPDHLWERAKDEVREKGRMSYSTKEVFDARGYDLDDVLEIIKIEIKEDDDEIA